MKATAKALIGQRRALEAARFFIADEVEHMRCMFLPNPTEEEADDIECAQALLSLVENALVGPKPEPDSTEPGGNTCHKCGGHSFQLQATFNGTVDVTFDESDAELFDVDDTEPGDSEWDGPATCRNCDWSGTLADLVSAPEKKLDRKRGKK